jgi:hypothetical protein
MILHVNFLPQRQMSGVSDLISTLFRVAEERSTSSAALAHLRVHLDWIQYRANFREPVTIRRAADGRGEPVPLAELAIDLRQASPDRWRDQLVRALASITAEDPAPSGGVVLEDFGPLSDGTIWQFNRLFWQRVTDWERQTGRGFETALPSGRSDANDEGSVADAVADFWTLLVELDKRGQLPAEIFVLEIGVGSGTRAALWLDRFKALDAARSTGYYPRLRFLLGDYSVPTLDRAMEAVASHGETVSMIAMDALNPLRALAFLRYKILYIHLTNVYDNLPADELVRRDGDVYLVEARSYLPEPAVQSLGDAFGLSRWELPATVAKLLEVGPDLFGDRDRGVAFWRRVWDGLRLEERLRRLDGIAEVPLPPGLDPSHLEDLLATAPGDVRFHISRGAAESFVNTLPLLHPRGYLQVQDIFVAKMEEYRQGFRGPGKLDGSVVNWVNGALLSAVAARAGYDVHFAPFRYRPGSRTSIMYTSVRD